jgi:hypothetical protein
MRRFQAYLIETLRRACAQSGSFSYSGPASNFVRPVTISVDSGAIH